MATTPDVLFRRYRIPTESDLDDIRWRFICGQCPSARAYRRGPQELSFEQAAQGYSRHYNKYHITLEEAIR